MEQGSNPRSVTYQMYGALMFWLSIAVYEITSKLSGIKLLFVTFTNSVGQEWGQGIKGAICLCSTMSGASAGRLEG